MSTDPRQFALDNRNDQLQAWVEQVRRQTNDCFQDAASVGNLDGLKILMAVADPKADESYALQVAAQGGHLACVEFLIPLSDPTAHDSTAIRYALDEEFIECARALLPVSNMVRDGWLVFGDMLSSKLWAMVPSLVEAMHQAGLAWDGTLNPACLVEMDAWAASQDFSESQSQALLTLFPAAALPHLHAVCLAEALDQELPQASPRVKLPRL